MRKHLFASLALMLLASASFAATPVFHSKWGSQGAGNGQFELPWGIAVDGFGYSYVADYENHSIQKFDASGNFVKSWGTLGIADGEFDLPYGVALDGAGNVYVTEIGNNRVQKFDSDGNHLMTFGSVGSGNGKFSAPQGIVVNVNGDIFVADGLNHRIQKFDASGNYITKWGSFGSAIGMFRVPQGLAVDISHNVYVVDQGNHRVQKFDQHGTFLDSFGMFGLGNGDLAYPQGIAISNTGSIFVASLSQHHVQKFDAMGNFQERWGVNGAGDGEFNYPTGVAVREDTIYVVDGHNYRVQKFFDPTPKPGPAPTIVLQAQIDILPAEYPNRVDPDADPTVRVALVGDANWDPAAVDISTLRLRGAAPVASWVEDVSAAMAAAGCYTGTASFDGHDDLVLEFRTGDLAEALGTLTADDYALLELTGKLADGTRFVGADCIEIFARGPGDIFDFTILRRDPNLPLRTIEYAVPEPARVSIQVIDVAGRVVDRLANDWHAAGRYDLNWPATGLPSGVYFIRMMSGDRTVVKRVSLQN